MRAVAARPPLGAGLKHRKKAEKVQKGKRFSLLWAFLLMIIVAGVFVSSRWALSHVSSLKLFPLERVVFSGNRRLSAETLFRLSGLRRGEDLFSISLPRVRANLERHPFVKRAQVQRQLPRTLRLEVEERKGVALLKLSRLYLVDDEGVILEPWKDGTRQARPLPRIEGLSLKGARPGQRLDDPSISRALRTARLLLAIPSLSGKELSLELRPDGGLRARALGGRLLINLGDGPEGERLEQLAAVLPHILKKSGRGRQIRLDLSFENRIIVRPSEEGGERWP